MTPHEFINKAGRMLTILFLGMTLLSTAPFNSAAEAGCLSTTIGGSTHSTCTSSNSDIVGRERETITTHSFTSTHDGAVVTRESTYRREGNNPTSKESSFFQQTRDGGVGYSLPPVRFGDSPSD